MTDPDAGPSRGRRALLATLGSAASVAIAGCQTSTPSDSRDGNDGKDGAPNSTADRAQSNDEGDGADGDDGAHDDDGEDDGPRDPWTVDADVPFRETPQRTLRADVYTPREVSEPPVVVHAHGGAWRFGDKRFLPLFGELADAGYAVVDVQYRLSDEATYPGPVRDVAAAVKWVRATADERGVDPSRLALSGYSAGGHLAALVATAPDAEAFRPAGFHPDVDVGADALVGNSGVYDVTAEGMDDSALIRQFLGVAREDAPERYEEASPITHVDSGTPPTLLCHGTDDWLVPYSQAERFGTALRDADVRVERFTADGGGHRFYTADRWLDPVAETQIRFLDDALG